MITAVTSQPPTILNTSVNWIQETRPVCVRGSYRHFRHPDWFSLLVADLVFQTLVPSVGAGLHVNACWKESVKGKHQLLLQHPAPLKRGLINRVLFTREEVTAVFLQFERLRVQAPGTLAGVGTVPLSHGLDVLAAVRVQKQNHGVVLDVVQPLHCSGRDVQQGVLVLGDRVTAALEEVERKRREETAALTFPHLLCDSPHGVQFDDRGAAVCSTARNHLCIQKQLA